MNDDMIDPAQLITRDRPGCPEWAKGVMKQIRVRASNTDPTCETDYREGWSPTDHRAIFEEGGSDENSGNP